MAVLENLILRDTRANQPAAGTAGRIYYVTDENVTERDSGSAWEDISDAGGGSGAPTTAKYVTTASDGTLSAEIVIPGLAGSASVAGVAGGGTAREFESGNTAPTWTPSDPNTVDVGSTRASHLYIKSTDATERLGLYSWSPAGAFDARCKIAVGSESAAASAGVGMIVTDSGNNNRLLLQLIEDDTNKRYMVQAYTYASSSYTQRGSNWICGVNEIHLRIVRDGSNNASFYWSADGWAWQLIATQSLTLTVANIGVRISASGAITYYGFLDWLRTDV